MFFCCTDDGSLCSLYTSALIFECDCDGADILLSIAAIFLLGTVIQEITMPEGKTNKSLGLLAMAGVEPYQAAPGEEYMNPKQLEHFRKILDAWRQQLREEVDRTKNHMADEAANFPDPVDRAAQEEEFSLELRARDRERKLLKKIEKTLQKIEDEDFGYCDTCGIEIGIKRLEARPTADQCIDCKTLAEIKEKQLGG